MSELPLPDYLLDADVLIRANNLNYPKSFWDWLVQQNAKGRLASVEKVGDELTHDEWLVAWKKARGAQFFHPTTDKTMHYFNVIVDWAVKQPHYFRVNVDDFFEDADLYLIAQAMLYRCTVVTHETPVGRNAQIVKIPNVCREFKVNCINAFDMLDQTGERALLAEIRKIEKYRL